MGRCSLSVAVKRGKKCSIEVSRVESEARSCPEMQFLGVDKSCEDLPHPFGTRGTGKRGGGKERFWRTKGWGGSGRANVDGRKSQIERQDVRALRQKYNGSYSKTGGHASIKIRGAR